MTFHLLWNVPRTTSFLWSDVPTKIQNLQLTLVASLADPTPQHSPLLLGGVVSSVQGAWGRSPERAQLPPFLSSTSACPWGCIPVCSLPAGELTRDRLPLLWQGWQREWDEFQTVRGGCTRKAPFPCLISNRAPFVSCFLLLIHLQSWEGNGRTGFSGSRHTQVPVINTISRGFSVPSMPKSWDTGEHTAVDGSSQSPVTGEKTCCPRIRCQSSLQPFPLLLSREIHHYLIFQNPTAGFSAL